MMMMMMMIPRTLAVIESIPVLNKVLLLYSCVCAALPLEASLLALRDEIFSTARRWTRDEDETSSKHRVQSWR